MQKFYFTLITAFCLVLFVATFSFGLTLTFDDHPDSSSVSFGPIGAYKGYNFALETGLYAPIWASTAQDDYGYTPISGSCTMFGGLGTESITQINGIEFYFDGIWIANTIASNNNFQIKGYNDDTIVLDINTYIEHSDIKEWIYIKGDDVKLNKLTFTYVGGFIADDLELSLSTLATPEPSTLLLVSTALLSLAGFCRPRRS